MILWFYDLWCECGEGHRRRRRSCHLGGPQLCSPAEGPWRAHSCLHWLILLGSCPVNQVMETIQAGKNISVRERLVYNPAHVSGLVHRVAYRQSLPAGQGEQIAVGLWWKMKIKNKIKTTHTIFFWQREGRSLSLNHLLRTLPPSARGALPSSCLPPATSAPFVSPRTDSPGLSTGYRLSLTRSRR